MMGGGGLISYGVWQLRHYFDFEHKEVVFGALAGGTGVMVSGLILALALLTTGKEFAASAGLVLAWHVPIIIIESIVVGSSAGFLTRVKPELLAGNKVVALVNRKSMENSS
jgi:ABC-type Co2+ transport system permease subunit